LTHPGRDRERGRLWRVVYKSSQGTPGLRDPKLPDEVAGLVSELASPSQPRRMLAMNALQDRFAATAGDSILKALTTPLNGHQHVHLLWLAHRFGNLSTAQLLKSSSAADPVVRIHVQRIASDLLYQAGRNLVTSPEAIATAFSVANAGIKDTDPHVQRAAVEALALRPRPESIRPILDRIASANPADTHFVYTLRKDVGIIFSMVACSKRSWKTPRGAVPIFARWRMSPWR